LQVKYPKSWTTRPELIGFLHRQRPEKDKYAADLRDADQKNNLALSELRVKRYDLLRQMRELEARNDQVRTELMQKFEEEREAKVLSFEEAKRSVVERHYGYTLRWLLFLYLRIRICF
jgi:hypothetical protein